MPIITSKLNIYNTVPIIIKNDAILFKDEENLALPQKETALTCLEEQYVKDWFSEPEKEYSAFLLEDDTPTPARHKWMRLRELFAQNFSASSICTRAMGLINWRKNTRFCTCCGGQLRDDKYETSRTCIVCGNTVFPHIAPAVVVLVHKEKSILLAQVASSNKKLYTCLAGYAEFGENLEECCARIVRETCGIQICNVRYAKSKSWPCPDQLMIAMHADFLSGDVTLLDEELSELKWFSTDALLETPKKGTIAWDLIHDCV